MEYAYDLLNTVDKLDLLFANIADPSNTMESIIGDIMTGLLGFVDELNKYAPAGARTSPITDQVLDIAERGRSLGVILLSARYIDLLADLLERSVEVHLTESQFQQRDGQEEAVKEAEAEIDELTAKLWGLKKEELKDIQASLEDLKS